LSDGAAAIKPTAEHDAHWEQLEKAVTHNWSLTTKNFSLVNEEK
jgi:hypothetical protein